MVTTWKETSTRKSPYAPSGLGQRSPVDPGQEGAEEEDEHPENGEDDHFQCEVGVFPSSAGEPLLSHAVGRNRAVIRARRPGTRGGTRPGRDRCKNPGPI